MVVERPSQWMTRRGENIENLGEGGELAAGAEEAAAEPRPAAGEEGEEDAVLGVPALYSPSTSCQPS